MDKPRVFVTRRIQDAGVRLLEGAVEYSIWDSFDPPPREVLLERAKNVEGILTMLSDRIDEEFLSNAPGIKVVSNYAVGYDNIDVPAATRRGVCVTNTPDVLTNATADVAFTLLLAAARRVLEANAFLRSGEWTTWHPNLLLGRDLDGATLGIVGLGKIGQAVAKRALGFGMKVLYAGPNANPDLEQRLGVERRTLDDLLVESDFVSLHCPLTTETRRLIGERELRMMKPTSILINASRGPVVDQPALVRALHEKWIWGAGLDVFEVEPVPLDDPILKAPNLTTLPHVGSATVRAREGMARKSAENLVAVLQGRRPQHLVNPEVWDNRKR